MSLIKNTRAYTLIEALVGLTISIFILAGAGALFIGYNQASHDTLETTRLEHELRTAMRLMVNDVRRAGYVANAETLLNAGINTNPFMAAATDIQVPNASCLLLTYDLNKDGTLAALNAAGNDERFGYRVQNQTLQTRAPTDPTFACNTGVWHNLTHPNVVQVTQLNVTLTPTVINVAGAGSDSLTLRDISITLTGRLQNDATVTRTLQEVVRVRNDKFTPAP